MDRSTETSAEIIQATEDVRTLVYTDSSLGAVGIIDITDPRSPVTGGKTFVGVDTSESYTEPFGHFAIVDIVTKTSEKSCDLGGQPDSVAIDDEGLMMAKR